MRTFLYYLCTVLITVSICCAIMACSSPDYVDNRNNNNNVDDGITHKPAPPPAKPTDNETPPDEPSADGIYALSPATDTVCLGFIYKWFRYEYDNIDSEDSRFVVDIVGQSLVLMLSHSYDAVTIISNGGEYATYLQTDVETPLNLELFLLHYENGTLYIYTDDASFCLAGKKIAEIGR